MDDARGGGGHGAGAASCAPTSRRTRQGKVARRAPTSPTAQPTSGSRSSTSPGGSASSRWAPDAALRQAWTVYQGRKQMTNPVVDLIGDRTGKIIPVYPQSEKAGLQAGTSRSWIAECFEPGRLSSPEPLPARCSTARLRRPSRWPSTGSTRPESMREAAAARRRLVFDELLRLQLALVLRKRAIERTSVGIAHGVGDGSGVLVERFLDGLPYDLTGAGADDRGDRDDLAGPHPMHRLLQGDVGAGKTVVAVSALLVAVQGGSPGRAHGAHRGARRAAPPRHQALLEGITRGRQGQPLRLFDARPLRVELLTNRTPAGERQRLLARARHGRSIIAIGTR